MWPFPELVFLKPIRNKNNDETSKIAGIKLSLNDTDGKLGSLVSLGVSAVISGFFLSIYMSTSLDKAVSKIKT